MRYDLDLILDLCNELGYPALRKDDEVEITLGHGVVLYFVNFEKEADCHMGTETGWHIHDNIMFCDNHGNNIEMDYLDVLTGLKEGTVLICEQWKKDVLIERSLVHSEFNSEFKYLDVDDEIRVRRATNG